MYPDIIDVRSVAKKVGIPEDKAANVWREAGLVHKFLNFALNKCHWHGPHDYETVEQIRQTAEGYIGQKIDKDAFLIGGMMANLKYDRKKQSVKIPPLGRLEEFKSEWLKDLQTILAEQEREIAIKPFGRI